MSTLILLKSSQPCLYHRNQIWISSMHLLHNSTGSRTFRILHSSTKAVDAQNEAYPERSRFSDPNKFRRRSTPTSKTTPQTDFGPANMRSTIQSGKPQMEICCPRGELIRTYDWMPTRKRTRSFILDRLDLPGARSLASRRGSDSQSIKLLDLGSWHACLQLHTS